MLHDSPAFSGFSVNDKEAALTFYRDTLGLEVEDNGMGLILKLHHMSYGVFVYEKPDHQPAGYTILNFPVGDISRAVASLQDKGVAFERYDGLTDEHGISRGLAVGRGPDIAWFKDPAGNILSVLNDGRHA